ncbi:MAG: hypothetical protein LBE12_01425 [Planctomycetaceae bacterium]|nr:hypothetical protein [Planctomycetaceae bacterium]
MPQADYYHNGNNSACGAIPSQLSTLRHQQGTSKNLILGGTQASRLHF